MLFYTDSYIIGTHERLKEICQLIKLLTTNWRPDPKLEHHYNSKIYKAKRLAEELNHVNLILKPLVLDTYDVMNMYEV